MRGERREEREIGERRKERGEEIDCDNLKILKSEITAGSKRALKFLYFTKSSLF